ncbi:MULTISPECIES: prepilin-type N-terminal cleavage/methylation domain-containing protein [Pontibacillus]|uniref:Prepilin-type N-terminal cleavage/methylation domain-containing protein n=1 Tax=Pontibacillus chungwhensis TaxID=265426 RepID=A0ABY8UUV8_9BACI|nr:MULTISPECIES: prepilin-type N-terminal cleavage/methylation domain-containing protein [Pontibacillus]MCD5323734.1 prepilin-type N-terminal cleavage/methylation domain-containing protein [Pontibacillus sp. HN14]WIF97100.1 prepilin-type N-terminal cleavage/methylation domain-containing protein [Pontibacillus chungwhensis]
MLKKFRQLMNKDEKGFTLVELLAVIVILGIIAAIAIPSIANVVENSKKDAVIRTAEQAVEAYRLMETSEGVDTEKTLEELATAGYLENREGFTGSVTPSTATDADGASTGETTYTVTVSSEKYTVSGDVSSLDRGSVGDVTSSGN